MAAGKKSFVLYTDYDTIFEQLTDSEAGKLIKHLFKYVNDKDPEIDDRMLKILFEPIKQQLKRDLKKWDKSLKRKSEGGKKGMASRWKDNIPKDTITTDKIVKDTLTPITDTVIDTVTVNVNDTVINTDSKWESIKLNFFNNWKWKEKFCSDKKIEMPRLEELMAEFINDVELKEDFKDLKELKNHFTNKFNKNGNPTIARGSGTSAEKNAAINRF